MTRREIAETQGRFTMNRAAFTANRDQFTVIRREITETQGRFTVIWRAITMKRRAALSERPLN